MSGDDGDVVVRRPVRAEDVELSSMELWDRGATAVEERRDGDGDVVLVASFPTAQAARVVAAALGLDTETVAPGWRDAWKRHADAIEVGPAIVVAPAWRPVPVIPDRLVLEIDPGACFGSGTHASTRLILEQLARDPPVDQIVLDVGTGSGILAVAAARLGARRVVAVDIDPDSIATTEANARRNGVERIVEVSTTPVGDLHLPAAGSDGVLPRAERAASPGAERAPSPRAERAPSPGAERAPSARAERAPSLRAERAPGVDVALVNVTAGVHNELAAAVVALVRPGGRLVLAGLLPGQWQHVAGAYHGCEVVDLPELDGWVGAVLRRTQAV